MKKIFSAVLALMLLVPLFASAEKLDKIPDHFTVTYKVDERSEKKNKTFISKDYIKTGHPHIDQEINALADAFIAEQIKDMEVLIQQKKKDQLDRSTTFYQLGVFVIRMGLTLYLCISNM